MIQYPTDTEFLRDLTNGELLAAYEWTSGKPSDAEANALLAEIERRGLDL